MTLAVNGNNVDTEGISANNDGNTNVYCIYVYDSTLALTMTKIFSVVENVQLI